jgi:hypothetical protein
MSLSLSLWGCFFRATPRYSKIHLPLFLIYKKFTNKAWVDKFGSFFKETVKFVTKLPIWQKMPQNRAKIYTSRKFNIVFFACRKKNIEGLSNYF